MIEFFTDPWSIVLAQWTMKQIVSSLLQISVGYIVITVVVNIWVNK